MPLSGERCPRGSSEGVDPFSKDFFLVPKPQLFAAIVGTFRSFGLLDAFGLDAGALEGFVREVCALVGADTTHPALPRPPARCPCVQLCSGVQPMPQPTGMRKVNDARGPPPFPVAKMVTDASGIGRFT